MDNQQAYEYTHSAIARAILYKRASLISLLQSSGVAVSAQISAADLTTAVLTAMGRSQRFQDGLLPILKEVMMVKHAQDGTLAVDQRANPQAAAGAQNGALTLDHLVLGAKRGATGERTYGVIDTTSYGDLSTDTQVDYSGGSYDASASADSGGGTGPVVVTNNAPADNTDNSGSDSPSFLSQLFTPAFVQSVLKTGIGVVANKVGGSTSTTLAKTAAQIEAEKTKQAQAQAALAAKGKPLPTMSTGTKIAIGVGVAAVLSLVVYAIVKKPTTAK